MKWTNHNRGYFQRHQRTESGTQQVTASITDDRSAPAVAFMPPFQRLWSRPRSPCLFPLSRLQAISDRELRRHRRTASGGGVDYTLPANPDLCPGCDTQNISMTVCERRPGRDDETVQIGLSSPANATLGTAT